MFKKYYNRLLTRKVKSIQLEDERIYLKLERAYYDDYWGEHLETYSYEIYRKEPHALIGYCDIRLGDFQTLYYLGHIGYNILVPYRGQRYSLAASRLLLVLARHLEMDELLITCNADNGASQRIIELLGGEFIDLAVVPKDEPLYRQGDRLKRVYRIDLR